MLSPKTALLAATFVAVLAACQGGGGGSGDSGGSTTPTPTPTETATKITGTVAAGTAIANATVVLKAWDANGNSVTAKGVLTDSLGNYAINLTTAYKPPYLVEVTGIVAGQTRSYHSLAFDELNASRTSTNINVTPLTEVIYANVVGNLPQLAFASPVLANYDRNTATTAEFNLRNSLYNFLVAAGISRPDNIDLIRTGFSANHTGMDKALDLLSVVSSSDNRKFALFNKADLSNKVVLDLSTKSYSGSLPATAPSDLSSIGSFADRLTALFANGVPSDSQLDQIVSSSYMNDGTNATALKAELKNTSYARATYSLESVVGVTGNQYQVVIRIRDVSGNTIFQTTTIALAADGWRFVGNGNPTEIDLATFFANRFDSAGNPLASGATSSGLILRVLDGSSLGIDHVVVKGKGIPSAGVTLYRSQAQGCAVFTVIPSLCETRYDFAEPSAIQDDFGYQYEFLLYRSPTDTSPTSYKASLPVKPLLATDNVVPKMILPATIANSDGTQVSNPTLATWRSYTTGDLPVYWALNSGSVTDNLLTFTIGLEIKSCQLGIVNIAQTVANANYQDTAGNREIIFTTDKNKSSDTNPNNPTLAQYFLFNNGLGLTNVLARELKLTTLDSYGRIYFTTYSDNPSATSCH